MFAKRVLGIVDIYGTKNQLKKNEYIYSFCLDLWVKKTNIKMEDGEIVEFEVKEIRRFK